MPINLTPQIVLDAPARFRVDFEHLVRLLLPALLRKPRLVNWLWALLSPLLDLYAAFLAYRAATLRELSYNGQTLVLQECLNDKFDTSLRRIRVVNADTELVPFYVNFLAEGEPEKPVLFAAECPPWLYVPSYDEFNNQIDFICKIPVSLNQGEPLQQLHARIRRLKVATVRYAIRTL